MEKFKSSDYQGRTQRQVENNNKAAFYNVVFGIVCLICYALYKLVNVFI